MIFYVHLALNIQPSNSLLVFIMRLRSVRQVDERTSYAKPWNGLCFDYNSVSLEQALRCKIKLHTSLAVTIHFQVISLGSRKRIKTPTSIIFTSKLFKITKGQKAAIVKHLLVHILT